MKKGADSDTQSRDGGADGPKPTVTFLVDRLRVAVYRTRSEAGTAAAVEVASRIRALAASESGAVRMVFAAAPSQDDFLASLIHLPSVPWDAVTAFHMDEYLGLGPGAGQLFGRYLDRRLFGKIRMGAVNYIDPDPLEIELECGRYAGLLSERPVDVACLGIGENGHLAFNDPPVADFNDPLIVKVVELDEVCRQQQVNDGAFASLDEVPKTALTMTIPALVSARYLSVVVPGPSKAEAVRKALFGPIDESCPASILRTHPDADLYLDEESARLSVV